MYQKVFKSCFNSVGHLLCSAIACTIITMVFLAIAAVIFAAFSNLPKDTTCIAYYTLQTEYIECGIGSSIYHTVELRQCPKTNDDPDFGVLSSWRIKTQSLILYHQQLEPEIDFLNTTSRTYHLLNGCDIYEWTGSVIEGHCCITNFNYDEQRAHLYLFLNETDAVDFQAQNGAHHELWSEPLNLPPNRTSCFQKWGVNAPYTVEHNSYHFFGVDLPANVELNSNITVLQMTVNVSDYHDFESQWFGRENHTDFSLPDDDVFYPTEYLFICGPPVQKYPSDTSTHVCSCKHPYGSKYATFLSVGIVMSFLSVMSIICACVYFFTCCYKNYYKCCCTCNRHIRRRKGFETLN